MSSSGDIKIELKVTATQLGGTKLLGEKETTVFDWSSSDGYTGTIDKTYNVSGSTTSGSLRLITEVDPADGDVFVEVSLSVITNLTGYGRFLVDMKNSSAFYFWVESVELSKRNCIPIHCVIGGPDSTVVCKIGGPDSIVACKIGGPDTSVHCVTGGPDSPVLACKLGPDLGACAKGPEVGCLAGPPLDVIIDPVLWDKGEVVVDLDKVPNAMRRSLAKMFDRILSDQ